jgi:hypothetical protein
MALCLALGVLGAPSSAFAQAGKEKAREHAQQGFDAYEAGRYAEAYEAFEQAEAAYHAPTHVVFLARILVKQRKVLDAIRKYESVLDEPLPAKAPPAFAQAQADARRELESARALLARIRVEVDPGADSTVLLDGAVVADASAVQVVDPGPHVIVLRSPGRPEQRREVEVSPGGSSVVKLSLGPTQWNVGGLTLLSTGLAGLAAGGALGAVHLATVAELEARCPSRVCAPSEASTLGLGAATGLGSTIALAAGGALTAVGVVFFLVPPFRAQRPSLFGLGSPAGPSGATSAPRLTFDVGLTGALTGVTLRGSF